MTRKGTVLCNPMPSGVSAGSGDSAEPTELRALTGLRAIAAFAVLLYHLKPYVIPLLGADPTATNNDVGVLLTLIVINSGYLGVDLFFILSGFIISYRYGSSVRSFVGRHYLSFLWARLVRIYPVHLVTLILMLGLVGIARATDFPLPSHASFGIDRFLEQLLLIAGWAVPIVKSWNILAWSISAEWAAYLAFPAVYALTCRLPLRWATLAVLLIANAVLLTWFAATHPYDGNMTYGLLRLSGCFVIGCLLQRFFAAGLGRMMPWHIISPVALMMLPTLALITDGMGGQPFATAPILLAFVIYGLATDDRRGLGRIMATRILRYCGLISYSLYMVHGIPLTIAESVIERFALEPLDRLTAAVLIPTLTGAALLLAMLLYHTVEVPCRQAMRRWYATPEPSSRSAIVI